MRYFTPDMYLRLNSDRSAVAERAAKDWEAAFERYHQHIERIRARMPAPVRDLLTLSLHDWELTQDPVELAHAVQALPAADVPFWLRFTSIGLRKADEVIVLFYLLWDDVCTLAPGPHWRRQQSPDGQPYWLYDEIDHVPPAANQYIHRVLFSDGTVREIPFSACYIYRLSPGVLSMQKASPRSSGRRKKTA
jgi:hypothetical protein